MIGLLIILKILLGQKLFKNTQKEKTREKISWVFQINIQKDSMDTLVVVNK